MDTPSWVKHFDNSRGAETTFPGSTGEVVESDRVQSHNEPRVSLGTRPVSVVFINLL